MAKIALLSELWSLERWYRYVGGLWESNFFVLQRSHYTKKNQPYTDNDNDLSCFVAFGRKFTPRFQAIRCFICVPFHLSLAPSLPCRLSLFLCIWSVVYAVWQWCQRHNIDHLLVIVGLVFIGKSNTPLSSSLTTLPCSFIISCSVYPSSHIP